MVAGRHHIAYVRRNEGDAVTELWLMEANGSHPRRLTILGAAVTSPAWSPDGREIAFSANPDGHYEIYVLTLSDKHVVRWTTSDTDDVQPAWSPDGKLIAFTRDGAIATVDAARHVKTLTNAKDNDSNPVWNPHPGARGIGSLPCRQSASTRAAARLRDRSRPRAGAGEVLVELRCAALNRRDSYVARGTYPFPLPADSRLGRRRGSARHRRGGRRLPGLRLAAGCRLSAGADRRSSAGRATAPIAELVALPAENLFPEAASFSWEEAAAFPLAALTAYRALFTRARLQPNETVLVLGAGSGVSTFAVQLAAQALARVFVTSSSDEKIDHAQELGAEWGVNYATTHGLARRRQGARRRRRRHRRGRIDLAAVARLRPRSAGRVVVFGATGGTEVALQVRPFYFDQLSLLGTMLGGPDDMAGLLRMVERRRLAARDRLGPPACRCGGRGRADGRRAHQFGKLVLTCS